ncbi:restriction endonuclease subunit S [Lactococcus raffinolactis]|uniref:restriction endonuclease subunit S n=1 Tax=Pseudolactococcus raffinolactis TaxID=1366 RepID=UPI002891596F|nr:restriction endonuclease subunit S [Lactococcus raffinolactis]MDT2765487.1 restriction endonuclease subunit S [Lactococcus raffinolactis]MDT2788362.1 restriction endonuclease subunit S [Lactococcus raffinolactis]
MQENQFFCAFIQKYTHAWEKRKLSDEVKINGRIGFRGYTQADIVTKETGVLAYSPTNIVNNQLGRKHNDTYITHEKYEESPEIMVKNSDILFVKTGSTLGKSALVQELNEQATVNPQIVIIRSKKLDEYFLATFLTSHAILKRINSIKIGGAIPTMTETELKKFPISAPKFDEQTKIGNFFQVLDNLLALHQRKCNMLKNLKKGYLQKMFPKGNEKTPEIRFRNFNGEWEEHRLGDVYAFSKGRGLPLDNFTENEESPSIAYGHLYTKYSEVIDSVKLSSTDQGVFSKYNDVLFPGSSTVPNGTAQANALMLDNIKLGGDIIIARELKNKVTHAPFTSYQINFQRTKLFSITVGSTITHMYGKDLAKLEFLFPEFKEQIKIGNLFQTLDQQINQQETKLKHLKQLKQAYLKNMFV